MKRDLSYLKNSIEKVEQIFYIQLFKILNIPFLLFQQNYLAKAVSYQPAQRDCNIFFFNETEAVLTLSIIITGHFKNSQYTLKILGLNKMIPVINL